MLRRSLFRVARPVVSRLSLLSPRCASTWANDVSRASNSVQIYISETDDPYLNLSIEHYLLQNAPQGSAILFLYVNRPCVVIGRNQNPWLEVNLNLLNQTGPPSIGFVDLVRRRSGGGTVFHDHGNVNWTVITPSETFTRDKHAEMIVRALRRKGINRARVNERHDIVLNQSAQRTGNFDENSHKTPWTIDDRAGPNTVKISGSAYKLTQGKALHHGTCLLSSPNLKTISQYLRSPAKDFITAYGVESVSSPVENVWLDTKEFQAAVLDEFSSMYPSGTREMSAKIVGEDALQERVIKEGYEELRTPEWTFNQTPRFTFEYPTKDGHDLSASKLPVEVPPYLRMQLQCRHGRVTDASFSLSEDPEVALQESQVVLDAVRGRQLHGDWNWHGVVSLCSRLGAGENGSGNLRTMRSVGNFLQAMLPIM